MSKGIIVRDEAMICLIRSLIEALPGAFGAMNVQCFVTSNNEIRIIEINARFGGGYPLAHRAGAAAPARNGSDGFGHKNNLPVSY